MIASLLSTGLLYAALVRAVPPAGPGLNMHISADVMNLHVHLNASVAFGLVDTYDHTNWFSKFDTKNITDPTYGFVTYVNDSYAKSSGLYEIRGKQVYIGVDHRSVLDPNGPGRNSVRLESFSQYNHGLIIADIAHMPGSDCGAWPAFWMYGPNWPASGEIDIIEGVNLNTHNSITLHTSPGCSPGIGDFGERGNRSGATDCGADSGYTGCTVNSPDATSYGTPFDATGGGVYATLWTSIGIQVWYWPASKVPLDIKIGAPLPILWGKLTANFGNSGCDIDEHFQNQNLVIDTTFCGAWAGSVWSTSSCATIDASCSNFVAKNPNAFADSYWLFNSIKVYGGF